MISMTGRFGWLFVLFLSGMLVSLHSWDRIAFYIKLDRTLFPWLCAFIQVSVGLWLAISISRFQRRTGFIIGVVTLLIVTMLFSLIFPPLNRGEIISGGSDRDEALNVATQALLNGQYPYTATGAVPASHSSVGPGGNPISPLPGELILAAPFIALIGEGAWQNPFWLSVFWITLAWYFGTKTVFQPAPASGVLVLLLSSPTITIGEIIAGGDLLTITLILLISCIWIRRAEHPVSRILAGILCGLAIATRPHFFIILPLLFAAMLNSGIVSASRRMLWVAVVVTGVVVPFWIWNPPRFSPLHAGSLALSFNDTLPYANFWLYSGLFISLGLFGYGIVKDYCSFEMAVGVILLFPVLFFTMLATLKSVHFNWQYAFYGISGWVFLITAAWQSPAGRADAYRQPDEP